MTQDEIRKLLGGYATNALSAQERKALFEAALEDQELFNALQDEDALRELLADPVTHEQVRQALVAPRDARRKTFRSRRWMFGVAIPAVAAVIVIVLMNRARPPEPVAPPVQIASNQAAPAPEAPQPKAAPLELKKQSKTPASERLARVTPPAATAARSFLVATPVAMPDAIRQQFAADVVANAPLYQGPLVRYAVIRGGPAGDTVSVEVTTGIAGYLALYEVGSAGENPKRVYPVSQPALRVLPDVTVRMPIQAAKNEKFRLVVVPAPAPEVLMVNGAAGAIGGVVSPTPQPLLQRPLTPLVVDIPLAPN
jgi:hypothetical protein